MLPVASPFLMLLTPKGLFSGMLWAKSFGVQPPSFAAMVNISVFVVPRSFPSFPNGPSSQLKKHLFSGGQGSIGGLGFFLDFCLCKPTGSNQSVGPLLT